MTRILLAGFGGQGILFAGKFLTYVGMMDGKEVSWLPSYGPEMRGGTANCSVVLGEERIGSPVVSTPDILICMNRPSLDKFEDSIEKGGRLFCDSSLVDRAAERGDIEAHGVPATQMANDAGIPTLANMVMLGKVMRETGICTMDTAQKVMEKIVPAKKTDLIAANMKALQMGYEYAG